MLLNGSLCFFKLKKKKKFLKMEHNPFKKGSVIKTTVVTPRKPNSARRAVVKLNLTNNITSLSYIPGIGHNLRKHSLVLMRGRGARDLPMVNYSCLRNKYDLQPVINRLTRRSIYGVKLNKEEKEKKKFFRI